MLNSLDLKGEPKSTRIVVAMSGGVDSSVVAALLKAEGYDVVGMTLQLYDHGEATHRKSACCAGQDIHDAKRVAEKIGIAHYVLDYETRFKEAVIDPFAQSYIEGETPIPCIACNQTVKFADLLATAKELDAAALATGHYIRSQIVEEKTGRRGLFRPHDQSRDQSYFLFATTQEQVDYLRFPLGHLPKLRTRQIAAELDLAIADKPDSQDICFVPKGKYSDIIAKLQPSAAERGQIVHIDGEVLGEHEGIIHFTIGQRRGIGIASGEPLYVVHLDSKTGRVIVGPREALATNRLFLRDFNWIGERENGELPFGKHKIFARVRSTRPPVAAELTLDKDKADSNCASVTLTDPQDGVAPGQACVLYADGDKHTRLLGGGFIERCERKQQAEAKLARLLGKDVGNADNNRLMI